MRDEERTKGQLIEELHELHCQLTHFRALESRQEEVEEVLRESARRLRNMVQQAGEGIFVHDLDGRFVDLNQRAHEYLGFERNELLELSFMDVEKSLTAERWRELWKEMRPGTPVSLEGILRRKDGSTFPADFRVSLLTHNGDPMVLAMARDITERKQLEAALTRSNEELERLVEERTGELNAKTRRLEEFNAALKVLLKQREEDRMELEESILFNVKSLVAPYVEKLMKSRLSEDQMTYLTILESHLEELTSPFTKRLSQKYLGLTPLEIQAANLIKEGKTTKEIAETLCVSENTVSSHRFHIRTKLGLRNKKINLRSYLKSLSKQ